MQRLRVWIAVIALALLVLIVARSASSDEEVVSTAAQTMRETPAEHQPVELPSKPEERRAGQLNPAEELTSPTHHVTGRVVDERRRPVPGARVALARNPDAISTADGEGRFLLVLALPDGAPGAAVLRAHARSRTALRTIYLQDPDEKGPREVDAGTLVLIPAHSLDVLVLRGNGPAPDAMLSVACGHTRVEAGEHVADALGRVALADLPPGPVHLVARQEGLGGYAGVFVPADTSATVELEPLGVSEVLVVDALTGAPIQGAQLSVHERSFVPAALPTDPLGVRSGMSQEYYTSREAPERSRTTDAEGRARIDGLWPDRRYSLVVTAEGYQSSGARSSELRVKPGSEILRVELTPLARRSVRWPVVAGEVPPPPDGASIRLRYRPGKYWPGQEPPVPAPGRMEGSTLVIDDLTGSVSLVGVAPDGALAWLTAREGADLGREISFRRPRRIEVRVHDLQGAPVVGAGIGARNQGNNEVCDEVRTDTEGHAVLESLYGGLVEVTLVPPGENSWLGRRVGTVDLEEGDGELDVELAPQVPVRALLALRVDGVPALPSHFQVRGSTHTTVVEELPERGELLLEVERGDPDEPVRLWIDAVGFARANVQLDLPAKGQALATIDLVRVAVLVARVSLPEEGRVRLEAQSWDEEAHSWSGRSGGSLSLANGPGGTFVFQGIGPGRWRVFDDRSGMASNEVAVRPVDREVTVALDLASLVWVSGRVEADDPAELARARVLVEGAAAPAEASWRPGREPPPGQYVRDGAFRFQVPGDREVRLVAWHPWLSPDPDTGRVTLRGPREGLVLRLTQGDELRLPAPELTEHHEFRLARYAAGAAPEGLPLEWHHAVWVDGVVRCALPRGRWTLLVEPGADHAPLVLPEVEIDGVTELPEARFPAGASLRVRVLTSEGSDAPRIYIFAERLEAPVYGRSINSRGEREVILKGLGPGRYLLRMNSIMSRGDRNEQEVVVEGEEVVELELDLR